MPQRPCWYQRYNRYCCAIDRNVEFNWIVASWLAARRPSAADFSRYGSTALLENVSRLVGWNCTRLVGLMQPTSSLICLDRPMTTDVEHPLAPKSLTVDSCWVDDVGTPSSIA